MPLVRIRYQTLEFGDTDIHVRTLRDNQQYADADGRAEKLGISSANWPLFGVIWASGQILARLMFHHDVAGKRILEVGCGIGLASLVLNHRLADITATDYHPEVESFLLKNVMLNNDKKIPFVRTGWDDKVSNLGLFDLIIGSDLLYESGHVDSLSDFIDQHAGFHCDVVLVDPGRGHHARFSKKMVALGYSHSQRKYTDADAILPPFGGRILTYKR